MYSGPFARSYSVSNYLCFTSILPLSNLFDLRSAAISNHGLETTVYKPLGCLNRPGIVRVGFWQNGFFADFYSSAAGFFADFVADFLSSFCGKKCPERSSRKIPGKVLQIYTAKIPNTFLERSQAKNCFLSGTFRNPHPLALSQKYCRYKWEASVRIGPDPPVLVIFSSSLFFFFFSF